MTLYKPMTRLVVVALLAWSSAGCGTKCSSWVVAGGTNATISDCSDKIERSVRCKAGGAEMSCECVQEGKSGASFARSGPLPEVHPSASELVSAVNKGCDWHLSR